MAAMGSYDSNLQMFVQTPREVDMTRLAFMRWLAENKRLEHRIAGPSSGPLVDDKEGRAGLDEAVASFMVKSVDGSVRRGPEMSGWGVDGMKFDAPGEGSMFARRR